MIYSHTGQALASGPAGLGIVHVELACSSARGWGSLLSAGSTAGTSGFIEGMRHPDHKNIIITSLVLKVMKLFPDSLVPISFLPSFSLSTISGCGSIFLCSLCLGL